MVKAAVSDIVDRVSGNALRNALSGALTAYGFVSFFCFIALQSRWMKAAPIQPNEALGLIYLHNEHGSHRYFSAFQATTGALLFWMSIPLAFVGIWIAPKTNVQAIVKWYGFRASWDRDDPKGVNIWATLLGAVATPLIIFFLGPHVIRGLNAIGIILDLG